jgi:predicted nucleotide-binding protein (sugar kinase/HSP70/actin superfamily)
VVINGEIFVRCHPSANYDSIRLLEKYGLEVMLNSSCHWIEYVNSQYIHLNRDSWKWGTLIVSLIKKRFMSSVSTKLYAPLADYLVGREPHDISHVLSAGQKELFYDKLVGGESPLSIGETYLFTKGELDHISGIYHVGPFGCMQETAASSQIQALVQKHRLNAEDMKERIVPFMDGVFGDSEPANFEAEIAAFSEKCYLRKELSHNGRS